MYLLASSILTQSTILELSLLSTTMLPAERAFLVVINDESVLKKENNSHLLQLLLLQREQDTFSILGNLTYKI